MPSTPSTRAEGEQPPFTHEDNRRFLQMLRDKKEMLGAASPKVEVRFEDLTVEAHVRIGRRELPTLPNCVVNAAQELASYSYMSTTRKRSIKIINGASGTIRPSRMTLLLGAPGSGKTTFLKALAGKLDLSLKRKGKLMYNGDEVNSSTPQRMHAYISQYDLHHAEMTVRETIDFASNMLGTKNEFEIIREATRGTQDVVNDVDKNLESFIKVATTFGEGRNLTTNYIIKILGLSECIDTLVGDEMRRGISGGQKKRLTIGEMLVGLAKCFFMDDISTGLDSSTTYEIIKVIQQMAHLLDLTVVISLLQPPPETLELFDDIILLCEGQIVYQGPRENATDFFEIMGFKCPRRKNIADFLQEVTSKMDQKQYWIGGQHSYHYHSIEKFAESFRSSYLPQLIQDKLLVPNSNTEKSAEVKTSSCLSRWNIFKACFSREVLLLRRNSPIHIFTTVQITILALVISTIFLRTNMNHISILDANKYVGALFIAVMLVNFNGMIEIAMTIKRLPTFYKQRELLALPSWALLTPNFLLSIPISLMQTFLWTSLTYYVIGYAPSFIRFMKHFLVLFSMHQTSMGMCRLLAAVARTLVMANVLATTTLIAIFIFGGIVISKDDLKQWLQWGYWTSPFTYAQNAISLNEFLDERWATEFHYENANTIGEAILKIRGFLTESHWYWICVSILFGFALVFNTLSIFALEFLNSPHKRNVHTNSTDTIECANKKVGTHDASIPQGVLPFQPLPFAFDAINYSVDMPKEMMKYGVTEKKLQLLQDVSGSFRPGVLTALMGITGAGKTTLLDVLAGRKTGGYIEGTMTVAGYPKKQETFSRISGYCEQSDIHSPNLTVYESLQFSARLRLPSQVTSHQRDMFIHEVMHLVELTALKNAMVGLVGATGLSAEQRKRLTMAVELVSSPSIIFMDEPTTGLDARSAAIVMRAVRKTVDTGRTVVCTIHQPSIDIFESFDELLLMKRGGRIIYSGSLGPHSCNMIKYFEAIPGVPRIKEGQNPAAWMLNVSSHTTEYEIGLDYAEIYRRSSLYKENMILVDELGKPTRNTEDLHFPPTYWHNFRAQCMACLWKQRCAYWKNPEHNVARFLNTFVQSTMFGIVFWQTGSMIKNQQDIFNILGLIYGTSLFLGFNNCTMLQPVVAVERVVLYREKAAGTYSTLAYAIAQVAIEMPYMLVQVFMFAVIIYPMIGFQMTAGKFFEFILYMVLSYMYYTLFGMMTVALTPNVEIASGLVYLIFLFWNVFSGFVVGRLLIPVWWRWAYWANPAAWTVYALMFSQLGDRMELILVPGLPDQTVREFLESYLGLEDVYMNLVTYLHVVIIALFAIVFFISLKYLNFLRR